MSQVRSLFSAAVVAVALSAVLAAPAMAQCPVGSSPFSGTVVDPVFELEGVIDSYDQANRTVTTNGTTFHIPAGVLISTGLAQGISFDCLVAPATTGCFPAGTVPASPRSILGGTIIATGTIDSTTTPGCIAYVPDVVEFLFAENVVVGTLTSVTPPNQLTVHDAQVVMNTDPRLPSMLIDGALVEHDLADLVGLEGENVGVDGYYDAATGVLYGVIVELETVLPSDDGTDVIAIDRAEWRADNGELRVGGTVVPAATMPTSVDLYAPGTLDTAGTGCTGTLRTSPAVGVDGAFEYRNRNGFPTNPVTVCVVSPNGGAAEIGVEVD
ncbi:MAG TPA: hypothetical protein VHM02_07735 [Thermoanaerobaculia bacterium]|nr:hypothetical protein [Thermoanaerobaculia bacterium]